MVSSTNILGSEPVRASVRFPLHLDVVLTTDTREYNAITEDVSANGARFVGPELPPKDTHVRFRLKLPAAVMGSPKDVVLQCSGRIVWHALTGSGAMAAAEIDEYTLKAEPV